MPMASSFFPRYWSLIFLPAFVSVHSINFFIRSPFLRVVGTLYHLFLFLSIDNL
jgi:hypothetical protein